MSHILMIKLIKDLKLERNKMIQLNNDINSLIEIGHTYYINCDDEIEKVKLDAQNRAYCQVKNMIERYIETKNKED